MVFQRWPNAWLAVRVMVALTALSALVAVTMPVAHAERFSSTLETTYLTWSGDFGYRTFQFIEPDGRRWWVTSSTANPRRTGPTGSFENGERVSAETISIVQNGTINIWHSCLMLNSPGDGVWSDGGVANPWSGEQAKATRICDPQNPAAAPATIAAPAPAAAATTTTGLCQIGRDSWGPSILEGSVNGQPTVVKLNLGKSYTLAQGGCFQFGSQADLEAAWPQHRAAFAARYNGAVAIEP